jgi:hypothetical protein
MKKAIIITAVLFVISSLLVVISAVALGADAIPKLIVTIKEGGILEIIENGGELFDNIENGANEFADKINDGAENYVGDGMFNGRNFSIIGDDEYCIGGERADGLDVSSLNEIRIRSDVGSVKLVMTDNSKMSASYNLYSDKTNANPDEYELILFAENYDIWLKSDRNIKGCVSELTVEIPVDYDGVMGVPITFLDKYNPDQFEILGLTQIGCHDAVPDTKKYNDYKEMLRSTDEPTGSGGGKTNENAVLKGKGSKKTYYLGPNGELVHSEYKRLFIRKKQ